MSSDNLLIQAIKNKEFGSIRNLVKNNPNSVNQQDSNGDTPLHHAVRLAQAYELDGNAKAASQFQAISHYLVIKGNADTSIKNNTGENIEPLIQNSPFNEKGEMIGGGGVSKYEAISDTDSINVSLTDSINSDSVYAILSSDFINDVFGHKDRDFSSPTLDEMLGGAKKYSKDKLSSISPIDSALELSVSDDSDLSDFSIDSFAYAPKPHGLIGGKNKDEKDIPSDTSTDSPAIDVKEILSLDTESNEDDANTDELVEKLARLHAKYNKQPKQSRSKSRSKSKSKSRKKSSKNSSKKSIKKKSAKKSAKKRGKK